MLDVVYQSMWADTPLISSLLRLRQELSKLILKHTERIQDPAARSTTQGRLYELLLNGLSVSEFGLRLLNTSDLPPRRTVHDRALTQRHRPRSLTGGRGKKDSEDGWPPRTAVEDESTPPTSLLIHDVNIPYHAMINTIVVFNGVKAR